MKTKWVLVSSLLALVNVPFVMLHVELLRAGELPADVIWHVCLLSLSVFVCGFCASVAVLALIDRQNGGEE